MLIKLKKCENKKIVLHIVNHRTFRAESFDSQPALKRILLKDYYLRVLRSTPSMYQYAVNMTLESFEQIKYYGVMEYIFQELLGESS